MIKFLFLISLSFLIVGCAVKPEYDSSKVINNNSNQNNIELLSESELPGNIIIQVVKIDNEQYVIVQTYKYESKSVSISKQ